jgi:CBS domain containing-hemolysin-like protein
MKYPIRFLNGSANFLLRRIGIEPQEELASARSADELSSLVRRSAEQGTLPKETAAMLERSLTFGELTAQDVMTPRVRVQSLHEDDPVSHVLDLARVTGLSRFPVIRENLDDVIGIIHIKQALSVPKNQRAETKVKAIMQAPVIVPFSLALDSLLEELRKGGLQMAIVIDEFGGMSGIVTVEDLLEELVGEVHDEHDRSGATIRRQKDGSWLLSGLLRPDEIADELDIFLPEEEEFETIAGLVTDRLEHIAEVGDTVLIKAVDRDGNELYAQLKVVRMDGRRIDRIQMRLIADSINLLGSGEAKS